MKIKKIYLDMDGVLSDFESRYEKLYNTKPTSMRDKKNFNVNWDNFVHTKQFEQLDWFPGANDLIRFMNDLHKQGYQIEILSSSGGEKHHQSVEGQKNVWLKSKGIDFKANIVPGRKNKQKYATSETILIDDTEDVIDMFNAAGGHGILHRNWEETKKKLQTLLEK